MDNSYIRFKKFLFKDKHGFNPFDYFNDHKVKNYKYPNENSFKEEIEIRCPICLKLAWKPVRPNSCIHVFCQHYLALWSQTKLVCPVCRADFNSFINIDLNDKSYEFQGSLFAY